MLTWCAAPPACLAGGGPENVLLVVNEESQDSLTIANYYARMRNIPAANVVHLKHPLGETRTGGVGFRKHILQPILDAVEQRKLGRQIDYVVYSSGFPFAVDLRNLFKGEELPDKVRTVGSITGATYLWPYVLQENPAMMGLNINWYVPDSTNQNIARCQRLANVPTRGFRARYAWKKGAERADDPKEGQRYLLSAVLGVTAERGNSVDEIVRSLTAAASADGRRPDGTFYFMQNGNIRSKPRDACFDQIARRLRAEGAKAQVLEGKLPEGARDVVGLMTGAETMDVPGAQMRILPGAVCEHLTSLGAVFDRGHSQTLLSEFVRAGAAGTSGTVAEPFALQCKFPLPSLHLHYRRGCSLGEAYYQSVAAPYQLLVVGDPLCQPWARRPECGAEGITDGQTVRGQMAITPRLGADAEYADVFVDGVLRARVAAGDTVRLNTETLPDGRHELRLVAPRDDPIETQGRFVAALNVDNQPGDAIELSVEPGRSVSVTDSLTLKARGPGLKRAVFRSHSRVLGRVSSGDETLTVPASTLGRGPVPLEAVDPVTGGKSAPVWVVVQ